MLQRMIETFMSEDSKALIYFGVDAKQVPAWTTWNGAGNFRLPRVMPVALRVVSGLNLHPRLQIPLFPLFLSDLSGRSLRNPS